MFLPFHAVYDRAQECFVPLAFLHPQTAEELFEMAIGDFEQDGHPNWTTRAPTDSADGAAALAGSATRSTCSDFAFK